MKNLLLGIKYSYCKGQYGQTCRVEGSLENAKRSNRLSRQSSRQDSVRNARGETVPLRPGPGKNRYDRGGYAEFFLEKGAFFDLLGNDISLLRKCIGHIGQLANAMRVKRLKVIYLVTSHHPGDAGTGPDSVFWHKEASLALYREHPEYSEKLLLPGTWGTGIVNELAPQQDDIILEKPRFSGFFDTNLDTILKRHNIKYLVVTGIVPNCCVEATIRDSYYRILSQFLISEAAAPSGPAYMHEAASFNIATYYGWVATIENILSVLK